MPRTRNAVAQQVAERLWATETAIDNALAEAAAFAGFMPLARMEGRLAAEIGHSAMLHAAEAVSLLAEARGCVIQAHKELASEQDKLRIRHLVATGDWGEKAEESNVIILGNVNDVA